MANRLGVFCIKSSEPVPSVDEIYTICGIYSEGYLVLSEMPNDCSYDPIKFRPIDYLFGKTLAEEIEQEINEENLVYEI